MRYNVESSGVAGYSDSRRVEMRQRVKRFGVGKSAELRAQASLPDTVAAGGDDMRTPAR